MALTFGINLTDRFSRRVLPSDLGRFSIEEHGPGIASQHANAIMKYLEPLVADYPDIAGQIHIINAHSGQISDPAAKKLAEHFEEKEARTGVFYPGRKAIGINAAQIQRGLKPNIGATVVHEQYGAIPKDAAGRILAHEFGHAVHNNLRDEFASRDTVIRSLFSKEPPETNWEDFRSQWERRMFHMKPRAYYDIRTNYLQRNYLEEIYGQSFQGLGLSVPEALRSRYAGVNNDELFAETFARSRIGEGAGFEQARNFEVEVHRLTQVKKMAANNRNVFKALKAMGSDLGGF